MITLHVLAQSRALRIVWLLELIARRIKLKPTCVIPKPCSRPTNSKPYTRWVSPPLSTTTDSYSTKAARLPTT